MTQRQVLTRRPSSPHPFETAKQIIIAANSSAHSSFMKLFKVDNTQLEVEDIQRVSEFFITHLAPHLQSLDDVKQLVKVFNSSNHHDKQALNTALLFSLRNCYHLFAEQQAYQNILLLLLKNRFSLIAELEAFHDTQVAMEFVSRPNVPDITPVGTNIIIGKSIHHVLTLSLKRFPDESEMLHHTPSTISRIAQFNASCTTKILARCHNELKYTLTFKGQLSLLQLLHEYDKAYIHACDLLQTAHDEGRYLTVRLAKHIYPVLANTEEREAVLAELPESVRDFYRKRLSRDTKSTSSTKMRKSPKPSLRLFERTGKTEEPTKGKHTTKRSSRR